MIKCTHTEMKSKIKMALSINKTLLTDKGSIELFTMEALNLLLKIDKTDIRKGDPNAHEPDYLIGQDIGIEITIAAAVKKEKSTSIIKEIIDDEYNPNNFSMDIRNAIEVCIEKKIKKRYSISDVSLAIQILYPDFSMNFVPDDKNIKPIRQKEAVWLAPEFFFKMYNLAIGSKKFRELYLILPFFDNQIAIYSIGKTFNTLVKISKSELGMISVAPDVFDYPVDQLVSGELEY